MTKYKGHFLRNTLFVVLGVGFIFGAFIFIWLGNMQLPDFKSFEDRKVARSTKIYDRTGKILLYDVHQNIKRTVIPYQDIGATIKNATVAIEDEKFYQHKGVRFTSIIRATLANLASGNFSQGGSTITQQVVKNTLLTKDKTITRKLKEWVLSFKLEKVMTKDEILGIYLNEVPYGGNVYGVAEAANLYFGKAPADLSIAESAYLAAIPQAPTYYSPFGKHKDALEARKNLVLSKMRELGFISDADFNSAKQEIVSWKPQEPLGIKAPHFVMFIKEYLVEKYGEDAVDNGGLKVTTTLDYDLEAKAEEIVKKRAAENETAWNASNQALVAIDPSTGQILTMAGSRDYFDKAIDGNFNIATALRQPGSSFKPFVYATAFKEGYTPETTLFDVMTEFQDGCDAYGHARAGTKQENCYHPDNYDNAFVGPISLRNALGQSRNIPSVQLLYLAGVANSIRTAEAMGISSLKDENRYGLTLVLGGGEVSLLEMTSAYGVFAANGNRNPYTGILSVEDASGKILESYRNDSRIALDKNVALEINNILSDNVARTPLFGAHSFMYFPGHDVAAKTGTTNNNKDAWLIGYTPNIVVGVWSGNNDNKPMKKGSSISGPAWNDFMNYAFAKIPNADFENPVKDPDYDSLKPVLVGGWQGGEGYVIDGISGKLATALTPEETKKRLVVTNVHSILHWVDKDDPRGAPPANPSKDSQYKNWETAVQNWWNAHKNQYQTVTASQVPTAYDDIHTQANAPYVSITNPSDGAVYDKTKPLPIVVGASGAFSIKHVDLFLNDVFLSSIKNPPFNYVLKPSNDPQAQNTLRAVVYDSVFNKSEASVSFGLQ